MRHPRGRERTDLSKEGCIHDQATQVFTHKINRRSHRGAKGGSLSYRWVLCMGVTKQAVASDHFLNPQKKSREQELP